MSTLRVLVADDEAVARRRLLRLLASMDDVAVAGECEDGAQVVEHLKGGSVDVILLDIQMPHLTGLEALDLMPEQRPLVVLCTAYGDHALAAFEKGAIDYLMKPVEAGRLKKALDRARDLRARVRDRSLTRLAVPTRDGIVLVDPASVSHAVLDGELVTITTTTDGDLLSADTLADLHARLPGDRFERVHRKALVNMAHVVRLEPTPTGGFTARMRGGQSVEVSRQSARELRRRLGLR